MQPLPHKDTHHTDVIVIGAGVLGTFHAYYAAKMGLKTLLIERNALPSDASTRNFGMVVQTTTIVSVESSEKQCTVKDATGNVFVADRVFVCSGAEYRTLYPERFRSSGLRICKLQMMQTVPQQQFHLPHAILSGLSIRRYPAFRSTPSYKYLHEEPLGEDIRNYGIHLLFKQTADGSVIIGDSHEYSTFQDANIAEDFTNCHINETILQYGQQMLTLPSWHIQTMWNGYYLMHPQSEIYTETIADKIHIVTGIAGKGMSTGPGFARKHITSNLR